MLWGGRSRDPQHDYVLLSAGPPHPCGGTSATHVVLNDPTTIHMPPGCQLLEGPHVGIQSMLCQPPLIIPHPALSPCTGLALLRPHQH